jgi:UDP-4-amino-4,6-dideoxy-N-acetyl-beta-L-altrosamine transaminase
MGEVKKKIQYGRQSVSQEDIKAVLSVLESDFLTQGPLAEAFEKKLCEYTGARYCAVVSSGTAALHLAVKALNLGEQSQGITSPNSFVASANCMVYNGMIPRFCDIDAASYCLDLGRLEKEISPGTRLLIPVHFAGLPCDMAAIQKMGQTYGLRIIEDAAHAIGSTYPDGSMVGNCQYSDMTIFSFHPVKTITTGEGGAITTNDKTLYYKIKQLANHGIVRDAPAFEHNGLEPFGPVYYEMKDLGYNYRITDLQCALGISQLNRIERFIQRRREIVKLYTERLKELDALILPCDLPKGCSSHHLYVIRVKGIDRNLMYNKLKDKGIFTNVHYIPIHLQPYYRKMFGFKKGDFPDAEEYYREALTLPLYPEMTDEDVEYIVQEIKKI